MRHLFSGGVHPADGKALTAEAPLQMVPAPDQVVIPLCQHIGAPCQSLVQVGDHVCMGQKIGDGVYGKSITDPCLGWKDSERLIYDIADYE